MTKKTPAPSGKKTAKASGGTGTFDDTLVRQLADALTQHDLTEIEYEAAGIRIRVARDLRRETVLASPAPLMMAPQPAAAALPSAAPAPAAASDPASHPGCVKAPMVGVVYLAPEPSAPNFVKVGDTVAEGQTLVLIEAMKTFNPVKAPRSGKVASILVENGAPVEYGEPLVIIE